MTPARTSGVEEPTAPAVPAFGARANDSARRRFAPRYLLNTIRNIPRIAASADVRALDDAFAGTPAVVVAAGPSLDRALDWLRTLPPHVLVIAVDTAARPLLEAGIEPHLVVAVDPSDLNARHLRHLPDTERTWLVAEGSLDPGAFEWFAGRTFTFAVSDHQPWPWLAANGLSRGRLRAWGSVLTSALDLALQAGCTPIAFAGADLAYTGGRPYCRGTVYEHDWARRVAAGDSLESIWLQTLAAKARRLAEDVHGRPVPTTSALLAFRDWIVEQSLAHPPRRFLNATGDGILRGGRIEQAPLPELAAQLGAGPAAPADPRAIVRDAWHRGRPMTGDSPARARAALASLAGAADGAEPLATWRRFAGPDLPESTLRQALAAASAGIATRPDRTGVGPTIQAAGAPERAEALRAAMSGGVASPVGGAGASAFPPGVPDAAGSVGEAALADARSRLVTLVASAGRLTRSDAQASPASVAGTAAVHTHAWTAAATPLVLAYEAALAALLRNPRGDAPEAWIRVSLDPPAPRTLDGPDPAADAPAELAARLGLIADGLAISAALTAAERGPGAATAGHLAPSVAAALLRACVAGIASSSRQPPATEAPDIPTALVSVALAGRRFTCHCAVAARDAVVARTGLLARSRVESVNDSRQPSPLPALSVTLAGPGPGDGLTLSLSVAFAAAGTTVDVDVASSPSLARRCVPHDLVRPVRVNPPSLPCMIGGTWDDAHALFTVANGTYGIRVGVDGTCEPDTPWPDPISGQVRWDATGAIAWHSGDRRVMWRERPDGAVHGAPMPLAGARAYPQPDGTILWTSVLGGLWTWTPGSAWRCLVETPPLMGLQMLDTRIRLEPRGRHLDFAVREPLAEAFEWTPGADVADAVPLGPDGPCWGAARAGAWTALAYPHADAVLLQHAGGDAQVLTCHYPFNVGWAGSSLVVSTGDAEVLLFPRLLSRLTPGGDRPGDPDARR